MKTCQCFQCGVSSRALVWGFSLLARDGWGIAPATNPPGAAERAWLCSDCTLKAESARRSLARLSASRVKAPLASDTTNSPRSNLHGMRQPAARVTPSADRPLIAPPREQSPLKVLVIDDHVLVLRAMVRLLADCDTSVASGGEAAWNLLQDDHSFDAIVSDVMMADLAGPELYARCIERWPELAKRFVFASADPLAARSQLEATLARISASHAPPLLSKPTSRETLMEAVSAVASGAVHQSGTYAIRLPGELASDRAPSREAPRASKHRN